MYSYRSISDLSSIISKKISYIPSDVDLVVGIPRSGMLPASIVALYLNTAFTDVYSYIENRPLKAGQTRRVKKNSLSHCEQAKHILVVDDSISSGRSMKVIIDLLSKKNNDTKITYCCIYGLPESASVVDIVFEMVPLPRFFEWNLFHHHIIESASFDIDGVLCVDPTNDENDDGPRYKEFILNAKPLFIPTRKIKNIVTSRLEKYRAETESWLSRNNVVYENLYMLDLPDAETRRRLGVHATYKAKIFNEDIASTLFIESEYLQAVAISNITGKDVFCTESMTLISPEASFIPQVNKQAAKVKRFVFRTKRFLKRKLTTREE